MNNITRSLLCFAIVAAARPFAAARAGAPPDLPAWLREAVQRKATPAMGAGAAVLHDESINTFAPNGRLTTVTREATRIFGPAGRSAATVLISYDSSCEKITDFHAWLINPDGSVKNYRIKDAMDISVSSAIYTEVHNIVLTAVADAYKGCVFACEYTKASRGIFGQNTWSFQSARPVALSSVTYIIPKDWTIKAVMPGGAPPDPVVSDTPSGRSHTWEMRDVPAIQNEMAGEMFGTAAAPRRIIQRLNIDVFPPAGMAKPPIVSFTNWADVSRYATSLQLAPVTPDKTVEAKTRELLAAAGADADSGLWERIGALARFAQSINYIEIAMNLGKGGGLTPRAAPEVLKTGYGDCKDKSTLLRSMLKVAGVESYAVLVYSGNRSWVTEDWPTLSVFNHMITAIKIDDPSVTSPMIVEAPGLGRLLFFDPTDQFTPLGDMPRVNQGALVLVLAGERGALVRLPVTPAADNHMQCTIVAKLDLTGAIAARVSEHSTGQAAAKERLAYRAANVKYSDIIRNWLGQTVRLPQITATKINDGQQSGTFDLNFNFVAPGYAHMMRDKLMVFKPALVNLRDSALVMPGSRALSMVIEPRSYGETVEIGIPDGFVADDLPPPVKVETSFGSYSATCAYDAATGTFRYTRSLVMKAVEIPAKDFASIKQFYDTIQKAKQSSVVLSREK